jgi:NAD(P)-dependent dehydrogenase (short-subunit alcohol dehydrogenase family)
VKTAIVTGGAGGLGLAIAARLAKADYRVGILDRTQEQADKAAAGIKGSVALQADVRSEDSVEAALAAFGDVPDLLVNNAGIARFAPLLEQTFEDFSSVIDVNLVGCFVVARAAARGMAKRGSGCIVNITSINGITPAPGVGAYPAAKAGLAAMTQHMALEWGPLGIRVNAVAPGFIDAGMSAPFLADSATRELRIAAVPTRSLGEAEDIAEAVFYLASDAAKYVSGHELVVDGGVTHSVLAQIPREAKGRRE